MTGEIRFPARLRAEIVKSGWKLDSARDLRVCDLVSYIQV